KGAGGEIQLTDAMALLLEKHPFYACHFKGIRFDCGSKVGFQMANIAFAMERPELRSRLMPFLEKLVKAEH
ncbi:MAG: UTP--glucose-1-phosphate uridylyltransferase, partial [Deltaproteobacteria bacterium]|nr:UTP--glucose-1-phosphate uridylyltransferase [Deltaproteobacteria bacterium]